MDGIHLGNSCCTNNDCNYETVEDIEYWSFEIGKYGITCSNNLQPPFDGDTEIEWTDDQSNCQCEMCEARRRYAGKNEEELFREAINSINRQAAAGLGVFSFGIPASPLPPSSALDPPECPCVHSLTIQGIVLEPATTTLLRIQTIITFQ
jgi:hypothetical protein